MNDKINGIIESHKGKTRFAGKDNPVIKHAAALLSNTKPNPKKLVVIEGIWAFGMALRAGLEMIHLLLAPECVYSPEAVSLAERASEISGDISVLSKKVFASLSERDEPDGLMAVCRLPVWGVSDIKRDDALVVVLDGLEIPGNIGTILRSADAAGVDAVLVCDKKARMTHPKLIKGSMGAAFFVPVVEFATAVECRDWLLRNGFTVYLADTRAERGFHEHEYKGNTALVMGSERYGINREWYSGGAEKLSIPMLGVCDSLNVAIAATVVLYEMRLRKDGLRK